MDAESVFGNMFASRNIINARLSAFANDCSNRMTENNGDGSLNPVINWLTAPLAALKQELGDVATALSTRKSKTQKVDDYMAIFRERMSKLYIGIAYKLGGEDVPAMLEFYPGGMTEYTRISKAKMPEVLNRLNQAATTHAGTLGVDIATELQGFQAGWDTAKNEQEQKKGNLSNNRHDRTNARKQVEIALLKIVHHFAFEYPGDVEACGKYFDFSLLYAKRRGKGGDGEGEKK